MMVSPYVWHPNENIIGEEQIKILIASMQEIGIKCIYFLISCRHPGNKKFRQFNKIQQLFFKIKFVNNLPQCKYL